MYKKSITHYVAKTVIDILFYLSIMCITLVPFFTDDLFEILNYHVTDIRAVTIVFFTSGICCAYILFNLKQMYKSLLIGNPFTHKNVLHFRKIAVACIIISVIYLIKCFYMFTFGTLVISAIFLVGCLFCLTLKDLFKQAINYKAENDLTI